MDEKNETLETEENSAPEAAPPAEAPTSTEQKKQNRVAAFFMDILKGVAIGLAFIIPGFSGGSVAAILGIYERIVSAVADIFKSFKKSILTLLPVGIGMLLGIAALIYPIQLALHHYPIPTVTLFVGLALGGIPTITDKLKGGTFTWKNALALIVPLLCSAALCFLLSYLPNVGDVDLFSLNVGEYFLLILIGFVGSCALVVPGISGSMLLLSFGYYNPIVELITKNLILGNNVGISLAVLACLAIGLVAGFFAISLLMKLCLKKCPRGTHFAILGFIIGSVPAVYISTVREAKSFETAAKITALYSSPWYWVVAVVMLLLGIGLSLLFYFLAQKKIKIKDKNSP